ncbi:hypothetical protein, partial [uncultured Phocaeicola sp.]|uniref:hypothetical protein n=1 Tax=uncultured Phocaeicola sp. TaxID=990718 RepID=UPI002636E7CA
VHNKCWDDPPVKKGVTKPEIPERTFVPEGIEVPTNAEGYTRSSLKLGRQVHEKYKADLELKDVRVKDYRLPSGKKPDFTDFENKTVYELKPNNPTQRKKGEKQLAGYLEEIERVRNEKGQWKKVLDTY